MDYVAIYRLLLNQDAGAAMEGKFCGDSIPPSIKIGQSSMTVQFISKSFSVADSYTGFSLHYEANFEDCKWSSFVIDTVMGQLASHPGEGRGERVELSASHEGCLHPICNFAYSLISMLKP